MPKTILVIPDCQVKPGVDVSYLTHIGQYIVDKKPDIIVCLSNFWDMPSLSSYDIGKKSFEGRRYVNDVEVGNNAMHQLLLPLKQAQELARFQKKKVYRPKMFFTLGNHEQRIERAVENDAKLEGIIDYKDLYLKDWEVIPFLKPLIIEDVVFCHYLTSGVKQLPIASANLLLSKRHQSCVCGHQQGKQIATAYRADGTALTAIIAGSCYTHNEQYMGIQGNNHWRGIIMLYEVENGSFDESFISLNFLAKRHDRMVRRQLSTS